MAKILTFPDYYAHSLEYAHRSNYSGPRSGKASWLAVHTVQGSYSSCKNWFKNSAANVSAHYVVSSAGHTTQMVGENMIAWHIGQHNGYTIGIEHEGYAHDGHPPTDAMYHASAKLAAGICYRQGIPVSRILGHRDFLNQTHTDPGNEWDMAYYRKLVSGYMAKGTPAAPAEPESSGVKEEKTDYERINFLSHGPKNAEVGRAAAKALNKVARERGMEENFAASITHNAHIKYVSRLSSQAKKDQLVSVIVGTQARKYVSPKVSVIGTLDKTDILDAMGSSMANTVEKTSWRLASISDMLGFGQQEKSDIIASFDKDTKNLA